MSVDDLCFLQSGQDQRDEDQLGDDARHGGEQGTGQKRAEREAAAGQACQHEAHSTPHQTPRHHGGDESGIHHGQGVLHSAPDKAGHKAVGGQLKGHGDGDGKHRRHAEQHRAQQRSRKAHGQPPGAAQHKAAQQNGKMHGAQHERGKKQEQETQSPERPAQGTMPPARCGGWAKQSWCS